MQGRRRELLGCWYALSAILTEALRSEMGNDAVHHSTRANGQETSMRSFLDPIFHLAPRTIEPLVEPLRIGLEVSDNIARITSLLGMFRLANHPSWMIPTVRRVPEIGKEPLGLCRRFKLGLRTRPPGLSQGIEPFVLGEAHESSLRHRPR